MGNTSSKKKRTGAKSDQGHRPAAGGNPDYTASTCSNSEPLQKEAKAVSTKFATLDPSLMKQVDCGPARMYRTGKG